MSAGTLATELTVFVPPDEPVGVYLLTVRTVAAQPGGFGWPPISRWSWPPSRSTPAAADAL